MFVAKRRPLFMHAPELTPCYTYPLTNSSYSCLHSISNKHAWCELIEAYHGGQNVIIRHYGNPFKILKSFRHVLYFIAVADESQRIMIMGYVVCVMLELNKSTSQKENLI